MEQKTYHISDQVLNYQSVLEFQKENFRLELDKKTIENIECSRNTMEKASKKRLPKLLKANQGFLVKNLKKNETSQNDWREEQSLLLISNLNGIGKSLKPETIRLILLCKIFELARGYSGVSLYSIQKLVEAYNKNIIPFIPKKGGIHADIYSTPLCYLIYGLTGEGKIYDKELKIFVETPILARFNYEALTPKENDMLGLISGSTAILAQSLEPMRRAEALMKNANLIYSISFESLVGNQSPFFHKIHEVRNHKGQIKCSKEIIQYITEDGKMSSEMNNELFSKKGRLQDGYSFRCVCQIHGIVLETIEKTKKIVNRELNCVSTRPLVYPTDKDIVINGESFESLEDDIFFGGNFIDVGIAKSFDRLCMAIHELGSLSDRRICRINNPLCDKMRKTQKENCFFNYLPIQSITASLMSENKFYCHPSSNDVTPFSSNKGDFYCMGALAMNKINKLMANVERILAIEAIVSLQGIDRQRPLKSSPTVENLYRKLRKIVPCLDENSSLNLHLERMVDYINNNNLAE